MRLLAILTILATLQACSWVKLTEGGETVTVVSKVPSSCERLGATASQTRADVATIGRNKKKIGDELQTLARNSASRMGGDTIVPESEISDTGEQTFGVYRCGAEE
jgi:hypothetical protein